MTLTVESRKREPDIEEVRGKSSKKHKSLNGHDVELTKTHKLTPELIGKFHTNFAGNPRNLLVRNALTHTSLHDIAFNRDAKVKISHLFSHTIDTSPKATDQKRSGRCWMFAALNCMRIAMIDKYDLPKNFEFSQNHLFFFDKLEKANVFLSRMIGLSDKPIDDESIRSELGSPVYDGGGWSMFSNLVEKYGVIPKSAMPESHHSSNSVLLNKILNYQLRTFTLQLRDLADKGATAKELDDRKNEMMLVVYRIIADNLGTPPKSFDWEYKTNQKGKVKKVRDLTPMEFYKDFVPYKVKDKVLLINMPHKKTPFGQNYASWRGNNVVEGTQDVYLNLPYEKIVPYLVKSIKGGEPVYFSCDVNKEFNLRAGAMDMKLYDYGLVFDTPFAMTKAEQVMTRQSRPSHAMMLCGVNLSHKMPTRWRVENSWGKEGRDGYLTMTHEWFMNYTYAFAVDKKYLPEKVLELAKGKPIQMGPHDPI